MSSHDTVSGPCSGLLRPVLAPDVTSWFANLGQQRFELGPHGCHGPGSLPENARRPGIQGSAEPAHMDVQHQPMQANAEMVAEPPYDTKGSGMPVTGMMPRFMPTFSKMWNTNMAEHPDADEAAHLVAGQLRRPPDPPHDSRQQQQQERRTRAKPSSSPGTVKMKSVSCSGTDPPLVYSPSR